MKLVIQILVVILVALIINDTLKFLYDESTRYINTQIDVRDPYEAAEFRSFEPAENIPDNELNEDASIGWFWLTSVAGLTYSVYWLRRKGLTSSNDAENELKVADLQETPVPARPKSSNSKRRAEARKRSSDAPVNVEHNVSFISSIYAPSRPSEFIISDTEDAEPSNGEFDLRRVSAVPDFDNFFNYSTALRRADRTSVDLSCAYSSSAGLSQKSNCFKCDCNIEQFEERLGVVEHSIKQTEEATKEWAKRIEQSEVDLVNLNRQMYNVLSNTEFKAPNNDKFVRNLKLYNSPMDSYATNSFKFEDNSRSASAKSKSNWATDMESEVERKINEIKSILNKKIDSCSDSTRPQETKLPLPSIDENAVEREGPSLVVKSEEPGDTLNESEPSSMKVDELTKDWSIVMEKEVQKKMAEIERELNALDDTDNMLPSLEGKVNNRDAPREGSPKKDDDLMTKTLEIVKDIEQVVYKEPPRMKGISPKVPTHIVPPFKRISCAETDGTVVLSKNNAKAARQKSKFK